MFPLFDAVSEENDIFNKEDNVPELVILNVADEEQAFSPEEEADALVQELEILDHEMKRLVALEVMVQSLAQKYSAPSGLSIMLAFILAFAFADIWPEPGPDYDEIDAHPECFDQNNSTHPECHENRGHTCHDICRPMYSAWVFIGIACAQLFIVGLIYAYKDTLNTLSNIDEDELDDCLLGMDLPEWIRGLCMENNIELSENAHLSQVEKAVAQLIQVKTVFIEEKRTGLRALCLEHKLPIPGSSLTFNDRAKMLGIADDLSEHPDFKEFVCPISLELPEDPVVAPDGRIYDRSSIEDYIDRNRGRVRSPINPAITLTKKALITMLPVKNHIDECLRRLETEQVEEIKVNSDSDHASAEQSQGLLQRSGQLVSTMFSSNEQSEEEKSTIDSRPLLGMVFDA